MVEPGFDPLSSIKSNLDMLLPVTPEGTTVQNKISTPIIDFEDFVQANSTKNFNWIDTLGYSSLAFEITSNKPVRYSIEFRKNPNIETIRPAINNEYTERMLNTPRPGAINPRRRWVRFSIVNSGTEDAFVSFTVQSSTGLTQGSLEALGAMLADTRLAQVVKAVLNIKDVDGFYGNVLRDGDSLKIKESNPLDISGLSTEATLLALGQIMNNVLTKLNDLSTQTTLLEVRNKLIANPSTSANQATTNTNLTNILAKLSNDPATQTTLAAVLAKLSSDPASQTTLNNLLNQFVNGTAKVAVTNSDYAKDTNLTAVLNKLSSDPATQTTLALVLAILGNGNQKTQVTNADYAKEAGGNLAAILAKITSDPATQTTLNNLYQLFIAGTAKTSITNSDYAKEAGGNLAAILSKLNTGLAVTGAFFQAVQPVNGTVTANIGTGNLAGITNTVTIKPDTLTNQANPLKSLIQNDTSAPVPTSKVPATIGTPVKVSLTKNAPKTVAAQSNAKARIIYVSGNSVYVGIGFVPSADSYTFIIPAGYSFDLLELTSPLPISFLTTADTATVNVTTFS